MTDSSPPFHDTPELFRVSREYQHDPSGIDLGHTTATERMLYDAIASAAHAHFQRLGRPLRILDVCAASGGCAEHVLRRITGALLVLVDNEGVMCEAAKTNEWPLSAVEVFCEDAVTWKSGTVFDLILMNSAYHHIEDDRKEQYLRNMQGHLAADGRILVGEHFLPTYAEGDLASYRRSVMEFYSARIETLRKSGDPVRAVNVIRQTGRYCWERRYEYQVSMAVFDEHVRNANLKVIARQRLWPADETQLPKISGTFLVEIGKLG